MPNPSRVVGLNHAVAVAMGEGLEIGLQRIDELALTDDREDYYPFPLPGPTFCAASIMLPMPPEAYRRALALATNGIERNSIDKRLGQLSASGAVPRYIH